MNKTNNISIAFYEIRVFQMAIKCPTASMLLFRKVVAGGLIKRRRLISLNSYLLSVAFKVLQLYTRLWKYLNHQKHILGFGNLYDRYIVNAYILIRLIINWMHKHSFVGSKYPASKALFDKTNQQIEKWSKILFLISNKIFVPFLLLLFSIGSLIVYATTDLDRDFFVLPLPMW